LKSSQHSNSHGCYQEKIGRDFELVPEAHKDNRGFLARIYEERLFKELGLPTHWTEESHHHTDKKNNYKRPLRAERALFRREIIARAAWRDAMGGRLTCAKAQKHLANGFHGLVGREKKYSCHAPGFAMLHIAHRRR